jgi:hypothetical protein
MRCGGKLGHILLFYSEHTGHCSTMEFTDGNFWSSTVKDWEKAAQLARLVIQFGYLDITGDDAEMYKFTGYWSLSCKSVKTVQSRWTASPGLQKARSRADEIPDPMQRCVQEN